jgi:hypothetical protein
MTTIHTGNTVTTGFSVASDDTGDLVLKTGGSGGVTAATFSGTTQQATFSAAISQPGAFGFRNRIINGNMSMDQRRAGAAQTITAAAALAYTVDRWYAYCTGANVTGQQVSGSGSSQYRYQFTGAASVTKIGFAQRIEAANCYDLNGSTTTLSVDLANSLLTTVTWTAWYANTADTFGTLASPTRTEIATGTFTVDSTVTRYTTQITIPSAATTGIEIEFSVGAQTSGTWTIGDVQLESGSAATPFEQRPIGLELSLCQRYYETAEINSGGGGDSKYSATATAGMFNSAHSFNTRKRTGPSITVDGTITYLRADSLTVSSISVSGCTTRVSSNAAGVYRGSGGTLLIDAEL